eukprot:Nk52_evm1s691 gene=Nk52_evmTU1s691
MSNKKFLDHSRKIKREWEVAELPLILPLSDAFHKGLKGFNFKVMWLFLNIRKLWTRDRIVRKISSLNDEEKNDKWCPLCLNVEGEDPQTEDENHINVCPVYRDVVSKCVSGINFDSVIKGLTQIAYKDDSKFCLAVTIAFAHCWKARNAHLYVNSRFDQAMVPNLIKEVKWEHSRLYIADSTVFLTTTPALLQDSNRQVADRQPDYQRRGRRVVGNHSP